MIPRQSEERILVKRMGQPLGMIVAKPNGYEVYALKPEVWPLDRRLFQSIDAAETHIARCDRRARA